MASPLLLMVPLLQPRGQRRGQELQSNQGLAAAFPIWWLPDSWGPTLKKQALPSRCLRALGLCGEVFRPGPLGAGEGKGPADQLLFPPHSVLLSSQEGWGQGAASCCLGGSQPSLGSSCWPPLWTYLPGRHLVWGSRETAVQNGLGAHPGKSPRWSVR